MVYLKILMFSPEPQMFLSIAASVADATIVISDGTKKLLANGVSRMVN